MIERRKQTLHCFRGQVNSNYMKSKGVIKGQDGQRSEERSRMVKFIF